MRLKNFGNPRTDRIGGFVFDGAMILANFLLLDSILGSHIATFCDPTVGILLTAGI